MARPRKDWVGQEVAGGRYVVAAILGEGGMGQVYKARDRNIDADVVVKVPHRSMLEQPDFAERFTREIRSLVKLSHPGIVKVTDVGVHEGLPFAVMQYLPGGDLEVRRPTRADGRPGPVAPASLAVWLPGVAAALDYIHRERYIHRDVKPANILFDAQGHPFLGDFGVAKVIGSVEAATRREPGLTGVGLVLGTPEYMAPELIMGQEFDGRVDQYALAVTAYEMLCGRKPFEGGSLTAILVRQTHEVPPALAELSGPGAAEAARVVLRGLAKDPAERYATCAEFAGALVSVTSRMSDPAAAVPTTAAAGRLRCPACSREIPVPAAVLAAPERVRGRKAVCPGCQTSLRFANEGLALVLEGPADRMAPSTVIAMAPEPPPDRPSKVARTVPVGVDPDVIPTRRAATVRIESSLDLPPPQGRPAGTVLIPQPSEAGHAPVSATVKIESLPIAPDHKWSPSRRAIPIVVGAVGILVALAAASIAFRPGPERTLARLDPAPIARPVAPPVTVAPAIPRPLPPPTPRVERVAQPQTVAPSPAPASAAPPVPTPEPPPPSKVETPVVPTPAEDPGPAPPVDDKLVVVSLDELGRSPREYLGRRVLPTEVLWIGGGLSYGPGSYQRLSVEKSLPTINKGRHSDSPIEIVMEKDLADNFREMIRKHFDRSVKQYEAIADLRIVKHPGNPDSVLGVIERLEILHHLNAVDVHKKAWGRAFSVALLTPNESRPAHGRGEEWRRRFPGSILNRLDKDFKAGITQHNAVIFDVAMQQAAALANEAAKIRDAQFRLERARSLGVNNFPAPR